MSKNAVRATAKNSSSASPKVSEQIKSGIDRLRESRKDNNDGLSEREYQDKVLAPLEPKGNIGFESLYGDPIPEAESELSPVIEPEKHEIDVSSLSDAELDRLAGAFRAESNRREARRKAAEEAEAKRKAAEEAEAKRKAEAAAKAKAEAEAKAKAEAAAKIEAAMKAKREAEEAERKRAEEVRRIEAEAKKQDDLDAKKFGIRELYRFRYRGGDGKLYTMYGHDIFYSKQAAFDHRVVPVACWVDSEEHFLAELSAEELVTYY